MCWKYEWAKAINNLSRAICYVERAKAKIERRLERNKRNLTRITNNPKFNYPSMVKPVEKSIERNCQIITECEDLIHLFQKAQIQLYLMINTYGITKKLEEKTTQNLARGQKKLVEASA